MSNPNIWAPGSSIDASSSVKSQAFTSAPNQVDFTITSFQYAVGTGSLLVFVGSGIQRLGVDWIEVSPTQFQLLNTIPAGTIVYVIAFVEVTAVVGTAAGTVFTPAGGLSSTNVQDALVEVSSDSIAMAIALG